MAWRCDLTGKRRLVGHKVSHSNIKTKKRQRPNLKTKRFFDPETGQTVRLRLSTSTIRTLDKVGGPTSFLRKRLSSGK
ncbi:MAG: 50S ribosomal protein L28 [Bacteriovoracales bacterium]|nr:50S ribosomal protein L28 [Bacteriovoracales bacterium]